MRGPNHSASDTDLEVGSCLSALAVVASFCPANPIAFPFVIFGGLTGLAFMLGHEFRENHANAARIAPQLRHANAIGERDQQASAEIRALANTR